MSHAENEPPLAVDLLITGGFVVVSDEANTTYHPGSVAIKDGHIQAVGPSADVDSRFAPGDRIRADEHIVMPGLVNIHGHASNSLIRGLGRDMPLHDWLERVCWPCMNSAREEDIFNGVLLSCLEMLLNGVTAFADMWPGVGLAAEAVGASGQRAMLAHNIKDFGDPARGEVELNAATEAWKQWHGHADGRVMVGLGPHSVYTCQRELLADIAAVADENSLHVQIHGHETTHELALSHEQHGCTPIELMADVGLLGPDTIVAHAVHLSANDIQHLHETDSAVAHNIASNLILASGIAPVQSYLDQGLLVGLGTDGPGSNDGLDLLRDARLAALAQKGSANDATSLTADTALAMMTRHGAQALGMGDEVGSLEVGKQADIILIDLDKPRFTPRHYTHPPNILSHLVNCASGADVDTVIVGGRVLVSNGEPLHLDAEQIQRKAQQSGARVIQAAKLPH